MRHLLPQELTRQYTTCAIRPAAPYTAAYSPLPASGKRAVRLSPARQQDSKSELRESHPPATPCLCRHTLYQILSVDKEKERYSHEHRSFRMLETSIIKGLLLLSLYSTIKYIRNFYYDRCNREAKRCMVTEKKLHFSVTKYHITYNKGGCFIVINLQRAIY